MEEVIVSIICNTFNHEKYIAKTLDSFLMQKTNFLFEILIHDDASTDNTASIIREYEKRYPNLIKPIYEKTNQNTNIGYTSKVQYGRAKGKYIAICEGDDFWIDKNKLQKQVDFLEENLNYIGCVHRYIVVDENNLERDIKTFGYYDNEGVYTFEDFFKNELPSQLASLVFRNIYLDKNNGYPKEFYSVKLQGDIKFYLWLLTNGNIYRMKDEMSAYRFVCKEGGGSWSSRALSKPMGYITYKGINSLEKTYYSVYSKKINLRRRKEQAIVSVIFSDFKRVKNISALIRAIVIGILHPKVLFQSVFNHVRRIINK